MSHMEIAKTGNKAAGSSVTSFFAMVELALVYGAKHPCLETSSVHGILPIHGDTVFSIFS